MGEDAPDTYLDIGRQLKDSEVQKLWKEILDDQNFEDLSVKNQQEILKKMRYISGTGLRQLARITGVGLHIIRRL